MEFPSLFKDHFPNMVRWVGLGYSNLNIILFELIIWRHVKDCVILRHENISKEPRLDLVGRLAEEWENTRVGEVLIVAIQKLRITVKLNCIELTILICKSDAQVSVDFWNL